jgi:hypothetical protein
MGRRFSPTELIELSGPDSSFISGGGIDLADFGTTTGLRDTMTPIPTVLFS